MAVRNLHIETGDFMKILVIFTGGTIGSAVSDGWISPDDKMKYLLIKKYRKITGDDTEFDTINPYTILSENLSAENINSLIKCVGENINKYDGIIVTHGTDTLQYTAAALSYAFGCNVAPVVLVSSNYPLNDARANGVDNFIGAVEFIKSQSGRGVFVSYKNKNESTKIHFASRIAAHTESFDEIYSIDNQPFAFYDEKIILNPDFKYSERGKAVADAHFCEYPQILSVVAMPGDSFCYDLSEYKAVILRPYHSGTLNTESKTFADFCKKAKENDIPVFIVNVHGGTTYESSKLYDDLGITVLPMCSFISVYIKTWLAISLEKNIKEFVCTPVVNEFIN